MNLKINPALEDCRWVMGLSAQTRLVKIDEEKVRKLAANLIKAGVQKPKWDDVEYLDGEVNDLMQYSLVLGALNFGSWFYKPGNVNSGLPPEKWIIEVKGRMFSNWYGLVMAVNQALADGLNLLDSKVLANLSLAEARQIFKMKYGDVHLKNRKQALNELGIVMQDKYAGQVKYLLEDCNFNALEIMERLTIDFKLFKDEVIYNQRTIKFNKRAQHFLVVLYGLLKKKQTQSLLRKMELLTILADIRIPQLFRHFGLLWYENSLSNEVDNWQFLEVGSQGEVEIRAASVVAGDMLLRNLSQRGIRIKMYELDINLWLMAKRLAVEMRPFHLVKTTAY